MNRTKRRNISTLDGYLYDYGEIENYCKSIDIINSAHIKKAKELFIECKKKHVTKGILAKEIYIGCIYIAGNYVGRCMTYKEVNFFISKRKLFKIIRKIKEALKIKRECAINRKYIDNSENINKICKSIKLKNEITTKILYIYKSLTDLSTSGSALIFQTRCRDTRISCIIYSVCKNIKCDVSCKEIAEAVGISESTIENNYEAFEKVIYEFKLFTS